ncbi:MAG: response regulator [Inquilinaceae bacterium]
MMMALGLMIAGFLTASLASALMLARRRHGAATVPGASDSIQRLVDFAEAAAEGCWETDADLRLTFLSPEAVLALRLEEADSIGRRWAELAPERSDTEPESALTAMAGRIPFRDMAVTVEDGFGDVRRLRLSGKPIFDANGEFTGYRGVIIDATPASRPIRTTGQAATAVSTAPPSAPHSPDITALLHTLVADKDEPERVQAHIQALAALIKADDLHDTPPLAPDAPFAFPAPELSEPAERRTAAVLVVDDEAPIRDFVALLLTELGYRAYRAVDGQHALEMIERSQEPIDLVLADVLMPRMSGPDLAAAIAERHPNTAIVFMSGYENRRPAKARMLGREAVCLNKPFTPETLDRTLQQVIGSLSLMPGAT